MFRREFLLRNNLRFPEGYWRSEDLLFVARCYTRARRISFLADYTCYFWHRRDDETNISTRPFEIEGHYERLKVIIAAITEGTPAGALQDALLRRLYRGETLERVCEPTILDDTRTDLLETVRLARSVAVSAFPPSVLASLPAVQKLRGTLLEQGSYEGLRELARRVKGLRPVIERPDVSVTSSGVIRAHLRFWLTREDGRPLALVRRDDAWLLDPEFVAGLPGIDDFPVDDPLAYCQASLQLHDPDRKVWWYPEGDLPFRITERADGCHVVAADGVLSVDPATAAAGGPLEPGQYDVWFSGQILGVGRRRRLVMPAHRRNTPPQWTPVTGDKLEVRLDWSTEGNRLRLSVRDRPGRASRHTRSAT
jgi:hypothetical protein